MAENEEKEAIPALLKKEELSQVIGISARQIENLVESGHIPKVKKGGRVFFEARPAIKSYCRYVSDKASGRERKDNEEVLKVAKLRAEVALKESQGELHKLRTEIATGNYIPVEEVKANDSRFFVIFKNFALAIPSKVAGRISGFVEPVEAREIESDLAKEITEYLTDFVEKAEVLTAPKVEDVTKPKKMGRPRKNKDKDAEA